MALLSSRTARTTIEFMARWPFASFLVCVIVAVAVAAAFGSNESPAAWFFASWAMYALIVFGICAGVHTRMPRAIAIAVFAPLGPLPVLALFSALSDLPPVLFWLVPGEELCDFMLGRANDASDRKFAAMDLLHANAAFPMHLWGAAPCAEGGIYLVFERSDAGGRKIVHLDRAGTMATVPLLPEGPFSFANGFLSTDIAIVCVQDNGTDALWTAGPYRKAQRVAPGTAASNQEVQLGAPGLGSRHVAAWPGRGFVVDDSGDATVAGYSIDGQRQFTIPRADLMDKDAFIEALQALPEGQFVAVTWSSRAATPTSVKFDATGRVVERVTMPELGGLPCGLVSFADGHWWVWQTVSGTRAARMAKVRVQIAGRTDAALSEKLRAQFPFALFPLEELRRDTDTRWVAFPSGTGNLLVAYSEPSPTPTRPNPDIWDNHEWPPDPMVHFYLVEFASDSTIVHKQQVF